MTNPLVQRLRDEVVWETPAEELMKEAADEIERLRKALESVYKLAGGHPIECHCPQCEIFELLEPIVGNTSPKGAHEPTPEYVPDCITTQIPEKSSELQGSGPCINYPCILERGHSGPCSSS